jgi:hypothetical protein
MARTAKQRGNVRLKDEILTVLRERGPMGYCGLEDRCNAWRTPTELRAALGELVVEQRVIAAALPVSSGSYLVYGAAGARAVPRGPEALL